MCYTPQEVENIKYNYRLEQMERAFNFSEILGETFIDDCDALRPYEDEIVSVRVQMNIWIYLKDEDFTTYLYVLYQTIFFRSPI